MVRTPFGEVTPQQWDDDDGAQPSRAVLSRAGGGAASCEQARGAIVNIADLAAFETWPAYLPHGISKAGVVTLTRSLAQVLAPEVRVAGGRAGHGAAARRDGARRTPSICARRRRSSATAARRTSPTRCCSFSTRTTSRARRSSSTAAGMSGSDEATQTRRGYAHRSSSSAAGATARTTFGSFSARRARAR